MRTYIIDNGLQYCGYLRSGAHHPKIRCPKTGRCGSCGCEWPCEEHAPLKQNKKETAS